MANGYRVPAAPVHTEIVIKKSRFLTTAQLASTVAEARDVIAGVRAAMPDASHHVYAFRIGFGNSVTEGKSDDGEPSGTSGPPTLAVLRGSGIGDVVLVTTRYFGGTKLGTGGLVRAYTESAQEALSQLRTELKVDKQVVGLELPYSFFNVIKRLIIAHDGEIEDEVFDESILIIVRFVEEDLRAFAPKLRDLTSGQVAPVRLS